jgi:phage shock protein A
MRNKRLDAAKELRDQVTVLKKEIEVLEQKADELDGEITATKNRRRYEAQLTADLEELIGGVVSPQYLKQTIAHAIRTGLSADQVITPIQAAMDILHDPDVTRKERLDAIKLLSAFESSKPVSKEIDMGDTLGSVQDELNKLKAKHGDLAPKRKKE